jgi:hypothetical protein
LEHFSALKHGHQQSMAGVLRDLGVAGRRCDCISFPTTDFDEIRVNE